MYLLFVPVRTLAWDVAATSITPSEGITDISEMVPDTHEGTIEVLKAFQYTSTMGEVEYTAVFTIDETDGVAIAGAPMVLSMGAEIQSLQYDTDAKAFTIEFITTPFYIPNEEALSSMFQIIFIETVADPSPENPEQSMGPPASMALGYISTSVPEFQLMPPEGPESMGFGLTLTGPAGVTGFFKMYMPPTMLTLMGTMSGKTVTADDLAVFMDGTQASLNMTETEEGGVLTEVSVVFAEGNTLTTSRVTSSIEQASSDTVTREVITKERLPLSLALKKSIVSKNKATRLYGWLKSGKQGKQILILQKKQGDDKYVVIARVRTKANGYFQRVIKRKKAGDYQLKAVYKKGNKKSDVQTLTVE
ncbi:MAG: hypothetical protein A2458_03130 [Candidatus Kerfeldbacteria bacterium RIFOXYC2_FULL_38_9]|uniref:Uncharacterized protein n=1 Tax=Candidatus Kerfeldbacteria bacterium RIFOXYB2_FULL_38_14 TaxID=1798547 RepID=A0A1G2BCD0_9BACT|nr:MAG: hypothetical protein A2319_02725 [Candidatus Kerfeldbacteria bacterium RIFOXYB2_FULL_38_14]OGY89694.1 MAG: hypothetical protein A2458_03130 [Candidatus Kerfeldbacteria bacterium RIFOXYC2_FULL_38_9]